MSAPSSNAHAWAWCIGSLCVADGAAWVVNLDRFALFIPHAVGAFMALHAAWRRYGRHRHQIRHFLTRIRSHFMIKPTIGRCVLYYPSIGQTSDVQHDPIIPFDAHVVYVHSDRCINVAGFDHDGNPFSATSVPLLQDDDPKPEGGRYVTWMDYQKGQAAKTDAAEAALAKALSPQPEVPAAPLPAGATIASTDPARMQNNPAGPAPAGNVMRHQYRILTDAEKQAVSDLKDQGAALFSLIEKLGNSDELNAARRYARQAVMWAVAHVTG
jgi:hypothetical protein